MGDGTPNEYYAVVKWRIEQIEGALNRSCLDADTKTILRDILRSIDEVAGATNAFYMDYQKDMLEVNTAINGLMPKPSAIPDDINKDIESLTYHISELELRVSALEGKTPKRKPGRPRKQTNVKYRRARYH